MNVHELHELHEEQEINISGYGNLPLSTAKKSAADKIAHALDYVKRYPNDATAWKNAQHILYGSGVVQAMLDAIINTEKE